MSKKTVVLAIVAAVLGILTIYDYSGSEQVQPSVAVENGPETSSRLERFASLVKSEHDINAAYAEAIIPYAQLMAEAKTFYLDKIEPKQAARQLVKQLVTEQDAIVQSISIGEPHLRGDGVFSVFARVKIKALTHRSAFRVLSALANFNSGLTWRSFSVKSNLKEKQVVILGDLVMVLVQAVE
jgi:hypothetical protein